MTHGLNRTAVNNSLVALKNYAVEDKGMKVKSFPSLNGLAAYCTNFEVIFILMTTLDEMRHRVTNIETVTSRCSG